MALLLLLLLGVAVAESVVADGYLRPPVEERAAVKEGGGMNTRDQLNPVLAWSRKRACVAGGFEGRGNLPRCCAWRHRSPWS